MRDSDRLTSHTKRLPPLVVGDHVRIQNQVGPNPLKWDKTGTIIEVRQFDQYVVRVDGSGRVTLRNRKFLRKYIPVHKPPVRLTIDNDIDSWRNIIPGSLPVTTPHTETSKSLISDYNVTSGKLNQGLGSPLPVTPARTPTQCATPVNGHSTPLPSVTAIPGRRHLSFDGSPASPALDPTAAVPTTPSGQPVAPVTPAAPIQLRRSGRETKRPAWHFDYDTSD